MPESHVKVQPQDLGFEKLFATVRDAVIVVAEADDGRIALADSVLEDLRRSDPDRRVEAAVEDGLVVNADTGLLRVALENLLSNAWKFTSREPVARIELGATIRRRRRTYYVRDNDAGFDAAYTDKLCAPFQRLHGEHEFDGTGIGLATVQRVIHRHVGQTWAESAPGEGATFFTL